ncbi:MAG: hypothetical protein BRC55_07465 [Cyanobacteria bacterium SW_8_48_13]|nr:MAG: hypothetical protein BRC55_07465 [Cyanobacteria bacterium SW_8_48_13]
MSQFADLLQQAISLTGTISNPNIPPSLEQTLQQKTEQARTTCRNQGERSPDCAVAWDIVEELQAEKAHRRETKALYCEQHPEAPECLIYDF